MNYFLQFTDNSRLHSENPIIPNVCAVLLPAPVSTYYHIHGRLDAQLPDRVALIVVYTDCFCGCSEVSLMRF
jgi:hypothetical protein